ncbi:MAG: hypothetical protein E6Q40_09625 [Cupriavidus sp.]|nr:MAG: hypothetical protein E6Q40_09625 [Cupriavidus sp.]
MSGMDAVTGNQERVLAFFGVERPGTKREASGVIREIFARPENRHRWNVERARVRLRGFPDLRRSPSDPQDSHTELLRVAILLVKGFCFAPGECRELLAEYARRSDSPWSEAELEYKLRCAASSSIAEGYMLVEESDVAASSGGARVFRSAADVPTERAVKPEFDAGKLAGFAGEWAERVDLLWLANRSAVDPATVSADGFLRALYWSGEQVVTFDDFYNRMGASLWPREVPPVTGSNGVWFLSNPVDGVARPNPRDEHKRMSRRIEECVTAWRFLVLESDDAPPRLWLGALARLPLRIAAIYSSAGRSVHALVQVDARTKSEWDGMKRRMAAGLITLGADPGALSAVRLTRLPGCFREGDKRGPFPSPRLQKLLYLNPSPSARALVDLVPCRDVEARLEERALNVAKAGDERAQLAEIRAVAAAAEYYAPRSARLKHVGYELRELEEIYADKINERSM